MPVGLGFDLGRPAEPWAVLLCVLSQGWPCWVYTIEMCFQLRSNPKWGPSPSVAPPLRGPAGRGSGFLQLLPLPPSMLGPGWLVSCASVARLL